MTSPGYVNPDPASAVRNNADVPAGDTVLLGQLFACTEQGGALVAEATGGRLVHIDGVPSGLACNCVCPGCGRQMVAKKGSVQAHHFAHYAQQDGRTCMSAGETALHKLAKRVLNDRLQIALWMRSKRRELGGKSPEEFTTDDATRQRCVDLLPPKRSHR